MRLECIELIDLLISVTLIVGLWFESKKIIKYNILMKDATIMFLIKYFLCTGFILTGFLLEYAIIKRGVPIDEYVFAYFVVNRGFGLGFIITAVLHSLGLTLWKKG